MIRLFLTTLLMLFPATIVSASNCDYWLAKVDPKAKKAASAVNENDPKEVLNGIGCLLRLQGRKEPGVLYGSKPHVSQLVPTASVEVNALYQISLLFFGNDDFAQAIALTKAGDDSTFNSEGIVRTAFSSYRQWFKRIKKIGLEEARRQKLDPLQNAAVEWY